MVDFLSRNVSARVKTEGVSVVFRAKWSKNDPKTHLFLNFNEIQVNLEGILIGFGEK